MEEDENRYPQFQSFMIPRQRYLNIISKIATLCPFTHCVNDTVQTEWCMTQKVVLFLCPVNSRLSGLGAATLNFFVNVDAACRDPVDEFEYMEVRWKKFDGTLTPHAEAPPMPTAIPTTLTIVHPAT
jgi:hypothetical protein